MKKSKTVVLFILALFLLTACLAVLHSITRGSVPAGTLRIEYGSETIDISLDSIETIPVFGTIVNGKGEEHVIVGNGILLANLLDRAGVSAVSQVTVYADDEYSATVTVQELYDSDRVYLLLRDDDRPQIIVFGDSNSKRNVSGVVRIIVS